MTDQQKREIVLKLKLISNLTIGDKISSHYLMIQPDSISTKISRWIYGESRRNTVVFVRNTVLQGLELYTKAQGLEKETLLKDLKACKTGVVQLQETYCSDLRMVSELTDVIEVLTRQLGQ